LSDWAGRIVAYRVLADGSEAQAIASLAELRRTVGSAAGPADALVGQYLSGDDGAQLLTIHGLPGPADKTAATVTLNLVGRHNADDALGAAIGALVFGIEVPAILAGLSSFHGVARRFEVKGDVGGVVVLDDFGHHPTAIAATLAAVRLRYPDRRVWAVYEPLTFHRTAALLEPFAEVLATADQVAIADIYAVRDPDTTIVGPADLAAEVARRGTPAEASGSVEETADRLATRVRPGDVVLVMGGGRSYVIAERLVEHLRAPTAAGTASAS
jgi:UDP-N-acetylmuramate-alanine ligase